MRTHLILSVIVSLLIACGDDADLASNVSAITGPRLTHLGLNVFHDNAQGFDCSYVVADQYLDTYGRWQPINGCVPVDCYMIDSDTRPAINPATGLEERMVAVRKGMKMPSHAVLGAYRAPSSCNRALVFPFKLVLTAVTSASNWPVYYPMTPAQLASYDFYRVDYSGCEIDGKRVECKYVPQKYLPPGCTADGCLSIPGGF